MYCFPDIYNRYNTVKCELDALSQWFFANKLCRNAKKTKGIHFRPSIGFPDISRQLDCLLSW